MVVVKPPTGHDCPYPENAKNILENSVFLPVYKPMPVKTMDILAEAIRDGDQPSEVTSTPADACVHSVPESLAQDT